MCKKSCSVSSAKREKRQDPTTKSHEGFLEEDGTLIDGRNREEACKRSTYETLRWYKAKTIRWCL